LNKVPTTISEHILFLICSLPLVLNLSIVHIVICAVCYSLLKEIFTSPRKCRWAHKS